MFKRAMSLCAYCDWGLRLFVVTFLYQCPWLGTGLTYMLTCVLTPRNTCWQCNVNFCDHTLWVDQSDDAIEGLHAGHDMQSWGCHKFEASEYSVIHHGGNVMVVEEDGVAAGSRRFEYVGEGVCNVNHALFSNWKGSLDECRRQCESHHSCSHFSYWGESGTHGVTQRWCATWSHCHSLRTDPLLAYTRKWAR